MMITISIVVGLVCGASCMFLGLWLERYLKCKPNAEYHSSKREAFCFITAIVTAAILAVSITSNIAEYGGFN
jgi:hypothetical protein